MNRKHQTLIDKATGSMHDRDGHSAGATLIDRIFNVFQRRIKSGELPPRSRLPSVRQLAVQYEVSNETAHRAYDKLVAHGYVEPRRGSGFYVSAAAPSAADSSWLRRSLQPETPLDWRRLLYSELPYERRPGCGTLPDAWTDRAMLAGALRRLARIPPRAILDHEAGKGYLPLREQLQLKLAAQGIAAQPDQIIITAGAIEALHLVLWSHQVLDRNSVMIEDPGPPMHVQRPMAAGLEVVRVPRETDGPNIEAMRQICSQHSPHAFICSSILHNPTSTNLSPHKAYQVLKLAEEFDFIVIDDDTYGDLLPAADANSTTRLATLDQLQRVFHIGGFSKTLGAGLRVGYVAASREHIERVALYKSASTISTCTLGERVVHQILSQGKYRHHCDLLRSRLLDAREKTAAQLADIGCAFPAAPPAGMYLWGSLGGKIDSAVVARELAAREYVTAPAGLFTWAADSASYMRFNVAATLGGPFVPDLHAVLRNLPKAASRASASARA